MKYRFKVPGIIDLPHEVKISKTPDCPKEKISIETETIRYYNISYIESGDTIYILQQKADLTDSIKVNSITLLYHPILNLNPLKIPKNCASQCGDLMVIHYPTDHFRLDRDDKTLLDHWIPSLQFKLSQDPNILIVVRSHTDRIKRSENKGGNTWLSEARALDVYNYLVKHGINPARLKIESCASESPKKITKIDNLLHNLPLGQELSPDYISSLSEVQQKVADALNRRCEIVISYTNTEQVISNSNN